MAASPLRVGASVAEELDYYKKQYEQLEADLADFQASSKDLEAQLEADIDAAEKNERKLREQNEKLKFEVEEWKAKGKNAREEGNRAQNVLQREITHLREEKRNLELRLRDVEVVNDDYERQARHTEVSLEDLEGKYNSSIERAVMLEEEVKIGEQEREGLRIESQRLRDELGDLRVEGDVTLEKLRAAEQTIRRIRNQQKPSSLAVENLRAGDEENASEASVLTPGSPAASTTPAKSDVVSDAPTPPSPPLSDVLPEKKSEPKTPSLHRSRLSLAPDTLATPRPLAVNGPRPAPASKHTRGMSGASSSTTGTKDGKMRSNANNGRGRQSIKPADNPVPLPRSESLMQVRSLMGRMQKIEERVQAARSKLPAPQRSTPQGSPAAAGVVNSVQATPRAGSALGGQLPNSITVRRSSNRLTYNRTSSYSRQGEDGGELEDVQESSPALVTAQNSKIKRLSFGIPRPVSSMGERPPSSSSNRNELAGAPRPSSRTTNGRSSALGFNDIAPKRPNRMSYGSTHASFQGTPKTHRPSASASELRLRAQEMDNDASPTDFRRSLLGAANGQSALDSKASGLRTPGASRGLATPKTGLATPKAGLHTSNNSKSNSAGKSAGKGTGIAFRTSANSGHTPGGRRSSFGLSPKNSPARMGPTPVTARHDNTAGKIINGVTKKYGTDEAGTVYRKDSAGRIVRPRGPNSPNNSPKTPVVSRKQSLPGGVAMGPPPARRREQQKPTSVRRTGGEMLDDVGETF